MSRLVFLAVGAVAIAASFAAVFLVLPDRPEFAAATVAGIALPALVAGLVMTAYIAWDVRRSREQNSQVSQLSAQLVRKEIEIDRLSTVDELTGLSTRRHFDTNVKLEFERARRHGRPVAMVLVELDDLQELGEYVGKLSRGYMLSELGAILRGSLRLNDIGCRYTSDALGLLLPETTSVQARMVADKVRGMVARHEFLGQRADGKLTMTVSQGIAVAPSTGIDAAPDLTRAAEEALAEAKAAGRDGVAFYTPPPAALDVPPPNALPDGQLPFTLDVPRSAEKPADDRIAS